VPWRDECEAINNPLIESAKCALSQCRTAEMVQPEIRVRAAALPQNAVAADGTGMEL
jgi:hypothetical protein